MGVVIDDAEAQQCHGDRLITGQKQYRSDIDGLRAIAAFAVLVYHIDSAWLPGGFFGVDIFFVISGYVVSGSLARRRFESALDFFADFYARRCRRLLPSFILVCCTTGFAIALLSPWFDTEVDRTLLLGIAGTLGNANNWLLYTHDSYFDARLGSDGSNAFIHMWSLGVEEQFYCLYPAIFLVGWGQRLVYTIPWEPSMGRFTLIMVSLSLTSLGVAFYLAGRGLEMSTFYLMPARFWQLGIGSLLWQCCASPAGRQQVELILENRWLSIVLEILSLVLLFWSFSFPGGNSLDPLARLLCSMLPVCAASGCIMSGLSSHKFLTERLSTSALVFFGRMSYLIYLYHVPVLSVLRIMLIETSYQAPLCVALTLPLCYASFHLFEEPARNVEVTTNLEVLIATLSACFANAMFLGLMIWLRASCGSASGTFLVSLGAATICLLLFVSCLPRPGMLKDKKLPSLRFCAAILAGVMILHIGRTATNPFYVELRLVFFGHKTNTNTTVMVLEDAGGASSRSGETPLPDGTSGSRPKNLKALKTLAESLKSTTVGRPPRTRSPKAARQQRSRNHRDCISSSIDRGQYKYDLSNGISDSCDCAVVDKTTPFLPEHATCNAKVVNLPACYEDRPIDRNTFKVQWEDIAEFPCYRGGGWAERQAELRNCFTRKQQDRSAIFLLGDSHARSLYNGLAASTQREILPALWYGGLQGQVAALQLALEAEVREGDSVWYVLEWPGDDASRHFLTEGAYQTQVKTLYKVTQKNGAKLVLVEDWPQLNNPGLQVPFRQEPFYCHSQHILGKPTPCAVKLSHIEQSRAGFIRILKDMQTKQGVYVFNTTMFLCPAGECDYNIPNRHAPAYYDRYHFNPDGSRYLAPFICDFAKRHGLNRAGTHVLKHLQHGRLIFGRRLMRSI